MKTLTLAAVSASLFLTAPATAAVISQSYALAGGFNRTQVIADVYLTPLAVADLSASHLHNEGYRWTGETYQDGPEYSQLATSITETAYGYRLVFTPPQTRFIFTEPAEEWAGENWWRGRVYVIGTMADGIAYDVIFTELDRTAVPDYVPGPPPPGPGIPEPGAWMLMILGFGTAGALLRRRALTPTRSR